MVLMSVSDKDPHQLGAAFDEPAEVRHNEIFSNVILWKSRPTIDDKYRPVLLQGEAIHTHLTQPA
jgi:hypothetical protein